MYHSIILIASRPPAAAQGCRDRGLPNPKFKLRRPQKAKSEHEHARENEQEHATERMRNEGRENYKNEENKLPEGTRRAPNEGSEASGALLGAMSAQGGRQERLRSLLVAARGGPGGEKKLLGASWGRLGPLLGPLFSLTGPPGPPPGAPRGAPGGQVGALFCVSPANSRFS